MKKTFKLLLSSVMLLVLLAGMQITAFATIVVPKTDNTEVNANETSALPGTPRTATEANTAGANEADTLNNVTEADINPISANPQTGVGSMAAPAAMALLAATTATVTLCVKKRDK